MNWISNSDKKPEKDGLYLVSGGGKIWICKFLHLGEIYGWSNDARNPVVEAWAPLPEPYEKYVAVNDCAFCNGKPVKAQGAGQGTKTFSMMIDMIMDRLSDGNADEEDDEERDYAYNGIKIKDGDMLCFDNSAGEYAELSIKIKYCPFCGKELKNRL